MRWSDLSYSYTPFDENQRAIRGFWLTTLGINLENLPTIFREPFCYIEKPMVIDCYDVQKVYLNDIIGTSYSDYGGNEIIKSYMKIKRADQYISMGCVTKSKYFWMLKKPLHKQECPVILSPTKDGAYFVNGNGNHRIILYKMMMLSEIAQKYSWVYDEDYGLDFRGFSDISKKYWLNAKIRLIPDNNGRTTQ